MESAPRFFAKKVPEFHNTEEVSDAVEKHTRLTGEKVPNTPEAKLGVYMGRLESIFLNEDEETRKRNIEMLRENIHDAFVIKREEVPESYFELQQRIARERGQAVETIPERVREQMKDVIIEDQTKSLDDWVNYLTSNDAMYPTWFKYLAFRNIVKLSQFDKELGKFKERTKSTTAPFPDIYREALAQLCDVYEKAASGDKEALKDPAFQEFVAKKFPTQYAEFVLKNLEQSQENKEEIRGQWVKYEQGDMEGAKRLYESLQGKGTGWCTAGESTARYQIENGDFYVYYTNDADGNPTIPRLAIRMDYRGIGEVRGVLPHQEVEPLLSEILDVKLTEFGPKAEQYKKKSQDMKRLTLLEKLVIDGEPITRDDLDFLYERHGEIRGFGYEKDPRIQEVRKILRADQVKEALGLNENQIALTPERITKETVVYLPFLERYLDADEDYFEALDNEATLNVIKYKIDTNQDLTRDDIDFAYITSRNASFVSSDGGKNQRIPQIKSSITKEMLSASLGIPDTRIAFASNEIQDDTELYLGGIEFFLSDDPYLKDEYATALARAKKINHFIKEGFRDINELHSVMQDLPLPGHTDSLSFIEFPDDTVFYEAISEEKLSNLGKEFAKALRGIPYVIGERLDYKYDDKYPIVEVHNDGSFMICARIRVMSLQDIQEVNQILMKRKLRLANKNELKRFLTHDKLSQKELFTVYGNGVVMVRGLLEQTANYPENIRPTSEIVSTDDKILQGLGRELPLDLETTEYGDYESYGTTIAIVHFEKDSLEKYDDNEADEELYRLQDRLSKR